MESILPILLCLSAVGIATSFFLDDRCYIFPKTFIPDGHFEEYVADIGCRNGTIEWHYPHSFILVHFRRTLSTFTVCFSDGIAGYQFNLSDVTNGNHHTLSKVDTVMGNAAPVCIDSVRGEAILQMNATSPQTYMGSIEYRIM